MSFITAASIVGGTTLLGSYLASNASKSAANTVANATTAGQQQMQGNLQALSPNYTPYMNLGQTGVNQLNAQIPDLTQSFGPQQLQSNLAPNYQFMLNQGLGAQSQAMNVGGGGSNINTANTKFAEDYASNAYQNAFNNYQTQQTNIYNKLADIAGIGQQSLANLSNLATGNATNISNLGVGAANAQAAGQVGSAGAISSGLTGAGNTYALASLLNPANSYSNPYQAMIAQPGGIQAYFSQ